MKRVLFEAPSAGGKRARVSSVEAPPVMPTVAAASSTNISGVGVSAAVSPPRPSATPLSPETAAKRARHAALKRERKKLARSAQNMSGGLSAVVTPAAPPALFNFAVSDARDHAETPFEAYRDLEPLLFRLAQELKKTKATLLIWDPFFCTGSCVIHLGRLGFTSVLNENVDFYKLCLAPPEFDVLVTNPPFSADHMEKTLAFAAKCGKPWAVLIPDFCSKKGYWSKVLSLPATGAAGAIVPSRERGPVVSPLCGPLHFLGPTTKAYLFAAPGRDIGGKVPVAVSVDGETTAATTTTAAIPSAPRVAHVFAATFQCVWHLSLGASHAVTLARWYRKRIAPAGAAVIEEDVAALPQLALDALKKRRDESAAKPWRKKLSRQRKAAANRAAE